MASRARGRGHCGGPGEGGEGYPPADPHAAMTSVKRTASSRIGCAIFFADPDGIKLELVHIP